MRELIRPTLFMIARTGWFLAVVFWIVGQTWQGVGFAYGFAVAIDRIGIGIVVNSSSTNWGIQEQPNAPLIQPFLDGRGVQPSNAYLSLFVVAFVHGSNGTGIGLKHWLIVTIFALFYGVLKWVYRKRGTELSADE